MKVIGGIDKQRVEVKVAYAGLGQRTRKAVIEGIVAGEVGCD